MIDDDGLAGEIGCELEQLIELAGKHQRIEAQGVLAKCAKAGSPGWIGHQIAAGSKASGGVDVPCEDITNAAHASKPGLPCDEISGIARSERHLCDIAHGHAVLMGERIEPAGFADAIGRVPAGLAMHGRNDVLIGGRYAIIARQMRAANRREVAEAVAIARGGTEPGVTTEREVPEMMMGIDDRSAIDRHGQPAQGNNGIIILARGGTIAQ